MKLPLLSGNAEDLMDLIGDEERVVLIDTPNFFLGLKRFRPAEVFPNHFHESYDEYFAPLSGEVIVWQGRSVRSVLRPGASLLCTRGSHHALINESDSDAIVLFAKVPPRDDDTHWVEWAPEESR